MKARLGAAAAVLALGAVAVSAGERTERVTTSIVVPQDIDRAWRAIASFDELRGPLPFALNLGMPVPRRCTLDRGEVGATRTCHFDGARIVQRVRVWDPPRRMELDIIASDLFGGRISFREATYTLRPTGASTRITRTTTYVSSLAPAWYWRPIERWAVASEHDYLLADVRRRGKSRHLHAPE